MGKRAHKIFMGKRRGAEYRLVGLDRADHPDKNPSIHWIWANRSTASACPRGATHPASHRLRDLIRNGLDGGSIFLSLGKRTPAGVHRMDIQHADEFVIFIRGPICSVNVIAICEKQSPVSSITMETYCINCPMF